jgi:hypothetical protein
VTCCSSQLQCRDDVDGAREQHLPLQLHGDKSRRVSFASPENNLKKRKRTFSIAACAAVMAASSW